MLTGCAFFATLGLFSTVEATTTCPCVEGGVWSFEGQSLYFCENPTGSRTSWCPTQVNDDGSYTPELPMAFCEGDDLIAACEQAKQDNLPTCPCVDGGVWYFQGVKNSYCSDPTNAGYTWCAASVNPNTQEYTGNAVRCTKEIREACAVAEAALSETTCSCLEGGQWTFNGEPQSFCQTPNGIGKAPWCPTSSTTVTSNDLGRVSISYCSGRELEACQVLEGTKEEEKCPCVEGGQWSYNGNQYSYCESTPWCATETNDQGKFIGKWAECKGDVKAACHVLHGLQDNNGKDSLFGAFTQANTGCPCWFDLNSNDCACCEESGVQCGAPMQNYCTSKKLGRQKGCPGVPANHWTLSTTGYPCYWDQTRTDCAWCSPGGGQCGPGKFGPDSGKGNRCWDAEDNSYCDSVQGDCKHIPSCDSAATCDFFMKFGKNREVHRCSCNEGWIGNGLQCYNEESGEPSVEGTSADNVELELNIVNQHYVYPHESPDFPLSPEQEDLASNIESLFDAGATCQSQSGCEGNFVNFVQPGPDA